MMNALETPGTFHKMQGEFVCHEDIPEHVPGFDEHFTVCRSEDEPVYLVCIQKIDV